ncbi:hypothetical protein [Dyella koreensis]|uniref:Uncharacterized protein n=1 Tax=Dyella koreensis TaxID=311235 RepID=A0ABW8K6P4_9GAMM
MFAALEFDHGLFKPQIKWVVVECSGVGRKCGGPIAFPPRRDRAYFVSPVTARADAEAYADFKNRQESGLLSDVEKHALSRAEAGDHPQRHLAYAWDHLLMADLPLSWAVLEWSGNDDEDGQRIDSAYFTHTSEAEVDAKVFAFLRESHLSKDKAQAAA